MTLPMRRSEVHDLLEGHLPEVVADEGGAAHYQCPALAGTICTDAAERHAPDAARHVTV